MLKQHEIPSRSGARASKLTSDSGPTAKLAGTEQKKPKQTSLSSLGEDVLLEVQINPFFFFCSAESLWKPELA